MNETLITSQSSIEALARPYWSVSEVPEFIKRTDTEYVKLKHSDLKARGKLQNRFFDNLIEHLPDGVIISGGYAIDLFMNNKNSKDIDFFFTSPSAFVKMYQLITNTIKVHEENVKKGISEKTDEGAWGFHGYKLDTEIFSAMQLNDQPTNGLRFIKFTKPNYPDLQLVKLVYYEDAKHVIDTFDFTVTQIAFDNTFCYLSPMSIFDLQEKKLVLHRMQFPASTIRRTLKYASKGYYACAGSLANIAKSIVDHKGDIDVNNPEFVYID